MKDAVLLLICAVALAQGVNHDPEQRSRDPSEAHAICAADDSEGVLVAHENCNQFYVCSGGKPVALTCQPNLLFNPAKDQCDWPFNVDCGDRVTTPEGTTSAVTNPAFTTTGSTTAGNNSDPSEAPAICAADDSEGVLVAHENCNQFYVCSGGKPVALTCQPNLLFNPAKDQCDWPFNVDCGDRVTTPEGTTSGVTNPAFTTTGSTSAGNNSDPSEAPAICAADDSEGVLVAHENCNQFYVCSGGKPVALTCQPNLLFNPAKDQCDWPFNVDCGDRVTTPEATTSGVTNPAFTTTGSTTAGNNSDPSEAPAICAADDSEGVLVAHENCNQFYVCSAGKPVALTCQPNLLFNPAKDQCDWPFNVDCGDRVTTPGGTSSDVANPAFMTTGSTTPGNNSDPSEAPAICASDDSEGVLVAHENCNQFYVCSGGKPVALTCQPNLLFNPAKDQCDWPFNVDCGDRVTTPEGTTSGVTNPAFTTTGSTSAGNNSDPSEAPAICAADDSEGVLVAHENCNQFYVCSGGKPVALTCQPNLLFNPAKDQCDWPFNVDCGDRVTTPEGTTSGVTNPAFTTTGSTTAGNNSDPSEAPAICAADDSEGVLVAHENCNQFYVCSGGKPVALTCQPNLLFNPAKDQCDWPFNVDCGDRVTTPEGTTSGVTNPAFTTTGSTSAGNNSDPSEAPAICAADDSEGVLVAHENCNQFYVCSGGKPVALTCQPNLLFNPAKDQCDWPFNVDCGDRVTIPEGTTSAVTNPAFTTTGSTTAGNNSDPSEAPAICAADDSEGVLVAHENCNQFYVCSGGKPVALTCQPNLLFNPAKDQCDWPFNVDCGDRVTTQEVPPQV